MNGVYRYVLGYYRIRFYSSRPERVLNFALKQNIPIWGICREETSVSFSLHFYHRLALEPFCSALGHGEEIREEQKGFPALVSRFKKRWGFFLGLALFFLALAVSTQFVWNVEVIGNVNLTQHQIRKALSQAGLSPGKVISKIDQDEFAMQFQIEHSEFSYVSLNIIGTRALVEVREREKVTQEIADDIPTNLVSSISGKIVRYEVLSGQAAVTRGETVPRGALLISGVMERSNGAFSVVRAKGRVFAETERYFEEKVLFSQVEKHYTGKEKIHRTYQILGFSLSLPGGEKKPWDCCEELVSEENLSFFGRALPIVCREVVYLETREETEVFNIDRARNFAYDKYEQYKRDTFAPGYEILEENIEFSQDEEGITITVSLRLIEDIAEEKPFSCATLPPGMEKEN